MSSIARKRNPAQTRQKLVDATVRLMVLRGFSATTVDEICAEAKLTKGSFFHYFESKEAIGQAALARWTEYGMGVYADAWKDPNAAPLEQLHRLFDIMIELARRPGDPLSCVVGMLSQEMAVANPVLRDACGTHLGAWTGMVRGLLAQAKDAQAPRADFDPEDVAWFINSLWQGSMLIAKARQEPQIIVRNLKRARAYVDSFFDQRTPLLKTPRLRKQNPSPKKKSERKKP